MDHDRWTADRSSRSLTPCARRPSPDSARVPIGHARQVPLTFTRPAEGPASEGEKSHHWSCTDESGRKNWFPQWNNLERDNFFDSTKFHRARAELEAPLAIGIVREGAPLARGSSWFNRRQMSLEQYLGREFVLSVAHGFWRPPVTYVGAHQLPSAPY